MLCSRGGSDLSSQGIFTTTDTIMTMASTTYSPVWLCVVDLHRTGEHLLVQQRGCSFRNLWALSHSWVCTCSSLLQLTFTVSERKMQPASPQAEQTAPSKPVCTEQTLHKFIQIKTCSTLIIFPASLSEKTFDARHITSTAVLTIHLGIQPISVQNIGVVKDAPFKQ